MEQMTGKQLNAVKAFCSDNPGRYSLNSVLIEPDGRLTAADGTALVTVLGGPELTKEALVQLPDLKAKDQVTITEAGEELTLCTERKGGEVVTFTLPRQEGQFPNYKEVIPKDKDNNTVVCIAVEYLERLCKLARAFTCEEYPAIEFRMYGSHQPIKVQSAYNGIGWLAVVAHVTPEEQGGSNEED